MKNITSSVNPQNIDYDYGMYIIILCSICFIIIFQFIRYLYNDINQISIVPATPVHIEIHIPVATPISLPLEIRDINETNL
jgi:hypothetical protein